MKMKDVDKAIDFAPNNVEALTLKALIELKDEKE